MFQRIQKAIAPAWWLSSISDLRWDGVEHSDAHVLQGAAFAQKYINLYSKKSHDAASEHNDKSMHGALFMMNGLILPPREFFNAQILQMLLNDGGSQEEQELRAELGEVEPEGYQARIDELIPSFDGAFDEKVLGILAAMKQQASLNS